MELALEAYPGAVVFYDWPRAAAVIGNISLFSVGSSVLQLHFTSRY